MKVTWTLIYMSWLNWVYIIIFIYASTYPNIDNDQFPVMDWKEFYGNVNEPIPPNAPTAPGQTSRCTHVCKQLSCRGKTNQMFP